MKIRGALAIVILLAAALLVPAGISDAKLANKAIDPYQGPKANQSKVGPQNIPNLGQMASTFAQQQKSLEKQQREETLKKIKECNENLKNQSTGYRKLTKEDCVTALKAIKEKYGDKRKQLKESFKQYIESKGLGGAKMQKGNMTDVMNETKKMQESMMQEAIKNMVIKQHMMKNETKMAQKEIKTNPQGEKEKNQSTKEKSKK